MRRGGPLEVRAEHVVVAEGANSSFGRQLGVARNRAWPMGMALRGYYPSARHDEPWIESCLDLRDAAGASLPGYGWIFPLGDGRVNVGVGLLSTFRDYRQINTSHLLDAYVGHGARALGAGAGQPRRPPHRRPAADGRLGRPQGRSGLAGRGRLGRHRQPLQRRGHRLRLRDGPHGGGVPRRGAAQR